MTLIKTYRIIISYITRRVPNIIIQNEISRNIPFNKMKKMKKTVKLQMVLLLSVPFLPGCHAENARVVETKKQTTECVVGVWMPENQDKVLNNLEFHAANMEEGENGNISLTGGAEQSSGTWQYKDIGEIEISTPGSKLNFKLLNCKKEIVDGLTIYVKEQ